MSEAPSSTAPILPIGALGESTYGGLTYQIHVLGEVSKPGTYRLQASTRLTEALEKAGGVAGRGSERRIEVRRRGGGSRVIDLLSFKLQGNLDANPYLLDNDVIFVPLKEAVVRIEGTVKRPGLYELKNEKTLEDLVQLAGGFTAGVANPAPIRVIRYEKDEKNVIEVPNLSEDRKTFALRNADTVVIPHVFTKDKKFDFNLPSLPGDGGLFYPSYEERVFVIGAVTVPGPYPYSPYYDVGRYLTLAGGVTKLGKPRKIQMIGPDGNKKKRVKLETEVNPGDTIVVPEKYMAPESILSLVLGLTTSVLGVTTTILTLSR